VKKGNLFNSKINEVISKMGHTDLIVIADAGLPIPDGVERIDISLTKDVPTFIETLKVFLENFEAEGVILAEEIKSKNENVLSQIEELLEGIEVEYVSHEKFKKITKDAKGIIRTGECTPYANIILKSGVIF
jgi:D-ribose pyranase